MKRLVANNTSTRMHKEVIEQLRDNTLKSRWLKQQATEEFNLAKKIVNFLPIAPTNHLIYKIYNDIINGKFDTIGDINCLIENFEQTLHFAEDMLKKQGIIFDYRPDNTRRYEHINDAFTKNASMKNTKITKSKIKEPNKLINTKWYNPYEHKEFIITDLINNDTEFVIDFYNNNEDYLDSICVNDFEGWIDDNSCEKVAKVKVNQFNNFITANKYIKKKLKANRSIKMNEEVQNYIQKNDNRFNNKYIDMAKTILQKIRILPTYERIFDLSKHIQNGEFDDLPDIGSNLDLWVERAEYILKNNKILLSKVANKTFDELKEENLQYNTSYFDYNESFCNSEFELTKININNIISLDDNTREATDLYLEEGIAEDEEIEKIGELIKLIQDGYKLEPIVIDKNNNIIDGFHRCWAYLYLGINNIEAYKEVE